MGELEEWDLDWSRTPLVNPCVDCAYLAPTFDKVIRGGAWNVGVTDADLLPTDREDVETPSGFDSVTGFRCARAP